jgi:prefoldin subunit 5
MLSSESQQQQKRSDDLERQLAVVQSEISRVVPQVDHLKKEVAEQRAAILARLGGCGAQREEHEVRELSSGNQEQGNRVDELEEGLAGLRSEMCRVSPQVDRLKKTVTEHQAKIARLDGLWGKQVSNGDQQQQKRVDELEEGLAELRSEVGWVDRRVDELDLELAEQRGVNEGLDEGVEFCKASAFGYRDELAALRSETGLVGRVDALEKKVEALEGQIEGLDSDLEECLEREAGIVEDVTDKVIDIISARGLSAANMTLTLGDG